MMIDQHALNREILLAFWKVHILHHAGEGPVVGNWMLKELRRHGYDVSPGTLYPLLARLEGHGWLEGSREGTGLRARKAYRLTPAGAEVLIQVQAQMRELIEEVAAPARAKTPSREET